MGRGPAFTTTNTPSTSKPSAGENASDLSQVNQDAEYHEAGKAGEQNLNGATGLRMVPTTVKDENVKGEKEVVAAS